MSERHWRIPDRVFVVLTAMIVLLTWYVAIGWYADLPTSIPVHFDLQGTADRFAVKTWWSVLGGPMLQLFVVLLLSIIYLRPHWAPAPRPAGPSTLSPKERAFIDHLIRHLVVMNMLLVSLFVAYVVVHQVAVAFGAHSSVTIWMCLGLVLLLLGVNLVYYTWIARIAGLAVKKHR